MTAEFNKDLVAALGDIPVIHKDAQNPFYHSSYLTLDGIINAVRPIFKRHNLAFMQNIWAVGDGIACRTTIRHVSGEAIHSDVLTFQCPHKDPQKIASLITYLKRYQLGAFLGISTDSDDDGNSVAEKAPNIKVINKTNKKVSINVSDIDIDDGVPF